MAKADFSSLNRDLLLNVQSNLFNWLPGGKVNGNEFECGDLTGTPGRSLRINIRTGKWADFSTDVKGGDLISLYAAIHGIKQIEAYRRLKGSEPPPSLANGRHSSSESQPAETTSLVPPPDGVEYPNFTRKSGDPSHVWTYHSEDEDVLFFVARYDSDSSKSFLPFSFSSDKHKWVNKAWPEPRPLYNLHLLKAHPDKPVLIVEGEKAADAASKFTPPYVVVTWSGGSKAWRKTDFSPIYGRKVLLWPDADEPGVEVMHRLAAELSSHCPEIKLITPTGHGDGWDAADSGFSWVEFKEWAVPRAHIYAPNDALTAEPPPDPGPMPVPSNEIPISLDPPIDIAPLPPMFYAHIDGKQIPNYRGVAEYVFSKHFMAFDDAKQIRFDGRRWIHLSKTALAHYIYTEAGEDFKPGHLENFAKSIKAACFMDRFQFKDTTGLINISNGVIDVNTGELRPHDWQYLFECCAGVNYVSGAECPTWESWLLSIFENNIELIDLVQRMFGYILLGGAPFLHQAFVLYGSGRNGKSTLLQILKLVLGEGSYSSVSLSKLDKEFSVVAMDGKLANIVEETPTDTINAEIFKNAVGGGLLTASHKGFDEYTFECTARFVFACNDMPVFKDRSVGLEDRLVIIPFNKYFSEAERDPDIVRRLKAEMPGILNWSIEGAKMVLKDKRLPKYETVSKMKALYKIETNSVYAWLNDQVEVGPGAETLPVEDVYSKYVLYCKSSNINAVRRRRFEHEVRRFLSLNNPAIYVPDLRVGKWDRRKAFNVLRIFNLGGTRIPDQSGQSLFEGGSLSS